MRARLAALEWCVCELLRPSCLFLLALPMTLAPAFAAYLVASVLEGHPPETSFAPLDLRLVGHNRIDAALQGQAE